MYSILDSSTRDHSRIGETRIEATSFPVNLSIDPSIYLQFVDLYLSLVYPSFSKWPSPHLSFQSVYPPVLFLPLLVCLLSLSFLFPPFQSTSSSCLFFVVLLG